MDDPTARFASLVAGPERELRLDEGALCIAAHAHPRLDVGSWLARLDDIAAACEEPSLDAVCRELFERRHFRGDRVRYHDPENSFLDSVIERRRGIPITLSVLVIEVARRLDVEVVGVGMPGHFLVRDGSDGDHFRDPFAGGRRLDAFGCRALFEQLFRGQRPFDPDYLRPTPARHVLARMVTNLEHGPLARDPAQLAWMCELHLAIPGLPLAELLPVLRRYARCADPVQAARAYERVGASGPDDVRTALAAEARALRSRMN